MNPAALNTSTPSVRAGLVEALPFDKLRANGWLGSHGISRRQLLHTGAGLGGWLLLRPAQAADQLEDAIRAWTGGATVQTGRVKLDIAPLVEDRKSTRLNSSH